MMFWMPSGVDALVAFGFFAAGLADGSVSSFKMGSWLQILAVPTAIVGGSLCLRSAVRRNAAIVVLLLLALPAVLFIVVFGVLILSKPRWN